MGIKMRVYVVNLRHYNEGSLLGKWIDLPCDESELDEFLDAISNGGEDAVSIRDHCIFDSSHDVQLGELTCLHSINDALSFLSEKDEELVEALLVDHSSNLEDIVAVFVSGDYQYLRGIDNESDLGYHAVEDGWLGEVPDHLRCYIDYEAVGRDFRYVGWVCSINQIAFRVG